MSQDYNAMMADGEDHEEFCLRACRTAQRVAGRTLGDPLVIALNKARWQVLDQKITHEEYAKRAAAITSEALALTGPLEPSTEYVGYF